MISTIFVVIIVIGAIAVIYFANKEDKKDSIDIEFKLAPEKIEPPKQVTHLTEKPRPIIPAVHKPILKPLTEGKVKTQVKQNTTTSISKTTPPPAPKPNHKKNKYKKNK